MHTIRSTIRGRKGVAMIMVIIALALATILASSFISSGSTSSGISKNLELETRRAIAETGLLLTLDEINNNTDWRTDHSNGTWATSQSFGGGTYTVKVQDGTLSGTTVTGDSDLGDDDTDPFVITSSGTYSGCTVTLYTTVMPFYDKSCLMVVTNAASPSTESTARKTLLQSWGWKVNLISATDTVANFTSMASLNNVIYLTSETGGASGLDTRLKNQARGMVTEVGLTDKLLIYNKGNNYNSQTTINITDNTHYITTPFAAGNLVIMSAASPCLEYGGILNNSGASLLASRTSDTHPMLLALDAGDMLRDGKTASPAPRIALPWGQTSFAIANLNSNGKKLLERSLDYAGSNWVGFIPGIGVWKTMDIHHSSQIDSFDSTLGPYSGTNNSPKATIGTDADGVKKTGSIHIHDAGTKLWGDAYAGQKTKTITSVVKVDGGGAITGSKLKLTANIPYMRPYLPTGMPATLGDKTYSSGTTVINSDTHFKKLTVKGTAVLKINGNITIQCDDNVVIQDTATVQLTSSDTLDWYVQGDFNMQDSATVNTTVGDPTLLNIYGIFGKGSHFNLKDTSQIYAMFESYDGQLVMDGGEAFGRFRGQQVQMDHSAKFHCDNAVSGKVETLGGGVGTGGATYIVSWMENP